MKHLYKTGALLLLILLLMTGCSKAPEESEATSSAKKETETSSEKSENYDEITLDGMAGDVLKEMTLEEKIGQLFIVCTDSLDFEAETSMTKTMQESLIKYQPGGVVFFSFNLKDREQISQFIIDMQQQTKIPMFMAVDEEGGAVARIGNNEKMATTKFPSMAVIGEQGDEQQAYTLGSTIGKEIGELGFNLDFAPVADVISSEDNSEIGDRSFGSDPDLVARMVTEVVKGLQENNVSATLKHFPGQGSSQQDTHKGFADMEITIDELRESDFLPFKKGIKAGADLVMVSHIAASNVTGNNLPSSLSSIVVTDMLRNELGFDGIIITDAMNMKSITKFYDSDEAAVKAFQAGNDMILMPDDFELAVEGIMDKVESGKISEEDLDNAVLRILKVKIKRGIIPADSSFFF